MLCKTFKCSPKELDEMDYDTVVLFSAVYGEVNKQNPLAMGDSTGMCVSNAHRISADGL